jgi:hypothetical protein
MKETGYVIQVTSSKNWVWKIPRCYNTKKSHMLWFQIFNNSEFFIFLLQLHNWLIRLYNFRAIVGFFKKIQLYNLQRCTFFFLQYTTYNIQSTIITLWRVLYQLLQQRWLNLYFKRMNIFMICHVKRWVDKINHYDL